VNAHRPLALVGAGPALAIARSIAAAARPDTAWFVVELPPERIPEVDLRALIGRSPAEIDALAAVGLHALNHARSDLASRLDQAGYALARLVHPTATVDPTATLGTGVIIGAQASVGPDCVVDDGTVLLDGARLEAGARVGAYAWIGANVAVGFGARVGAHTIVRPGVSIDAGVPVGEHCELALSGLRQAAVPDRTLESVAFEHPVRVYRGRDAR